MASSGQWDLAQGVGSPGDRAGAGQPQHLGHRAGLGRAGPAPSRRGGESSADPGEAAVQPSPAPRAGFSSRVRAGRGHEMRGHWSLQPPPTQCPPRPGAPGPIPGAAGRGRTVVPPSQGSLDQISELSPPFPAHSAEMGGGGARGPGDGHMGLGPLLHPHTWPASHRPRWEGPQPHLTLNLRFLVTPANCVEGPAHTPATPGTFPEAPLSWASHSFAHSLTHLFNRFSLSTVAGGQRRREPRPPQVRERRAGSRTPGPGES